MNDIPRPRFDPTVNLGHVLSILAFVGMAVMAYYAMKGDIDKLEARMVMMEKSGAEMAGSITRLTEVVVITARQDERINSLNARIDRVERSRSN